MVSELTVIVKDSERTFRMKHLIYDDYSVNDNDPIIKKCVDDTLVQFHGEPESVNIKISLEIQ